MDSVLLVWAGVGLYFLPTIVAGTGRPHPYVGAVFTFNLLLGWTVLGWVAALVSALVKPPPPISG